MEEELAGDDSRRDGLGSQRRIKTKKQERTGVRSPESTSNECLGVGGEGWGETGREQASGKKRGPVQLWWLSG